jgi:Dyp-type peroxidase family
LDEVQGNVLSVHHLEYSAHLFLRIPAGSEARVQSWLRTLANAERITSMHRQVAGLPPDNPFLSVMVGYEGAKALGWGGKMTYPEDFRLGMYKREETFVLSKDDPRVAGVAEWEPTFQIDVLNADPIDLHLLLAAKTKSQRDGWFAELKTEVLGSATRPGIGVTLAGEELGYITRRNGKEAIEHFGFADGISNPQYLADDVARVLKRSRERQQYWDPLFPLKSVLVPVLGGDGAVSYGSFFVFRKIEQHVAAFREFERQVRAAGWADGSTTPGAMIVGRSEAGRPLAVSRRDLPADKPHNDFTYGDDRFGRGCPFHAHVRKSNPRRTVPGDNDVSRDHLFPRRGMLYGTRAEDFSDEPTGGVGLLFMAYMAKIEEQFEHVLRSWINDPGFPLDQHDPGTDSLIGEPPAPMIRLPISARWDVKVEKGRFVTTRGGEYFFVPPVSWFENLPP